MSEIGALVNLGELSKPATVLIEKISEAIGGIFRPHQIRRIAQAEAAAERIRAVSQIEITDLQRRAVQRLFIEEAKRQYNIESITQKALPEVQEGASPEKVEDDWITSFFDKCRLISDEEMQTLWSKVLAGEANSPGRYSKRTVNLLSSLDKSDAVLFGNLCSFNWLVEKGDVVPLIFDVHDSVYTDVGVDFTSLKHLDEIGLLSIESLSGYQIVGLPQKVQVSYYGRPVVIEFPQEDKNSLEVGTVLLSKVGQELAPICGSAPRPGFQDYVVKEWQARGLQVTDLTQTPKQTPLA